MIKKFKIEILVLFILFSNIFLAYNIDLGFFSFFKNFDSSLQDIYLKKFFVNITIVGDSFWYFAFSFFFIVLYLISKIFKILNKHTNTINIFYLTNLFLFFSVLTTGLITQILKHVVGRSRPNYSSIDAEIGFNFFTTNSNFHSFPSGHSSTIFVVALVLSFFLPKLKYFFYILASVVAFSRVVVGAHFFTDVVGGVAVAFIGYKISLLFIRKLYKKDFSKLDTKKNYGDIFLTLVAFSMIMIFLAVGPSLDIFLSSIFYLGDHQFVLQSYYNFTIFFRKIILPLLIIYVLFLPIFSLILPIKKIYFNHKFDLKQISYLWITGFVTILIFINLFLKRFWGRARPEDIHQLDGKEVFTPWYWIADSCYENCSFVSGDSSVGFSVIALYFIIKNKIYYWAAMFFGISLGIVRIMEGGHFLSDVVMSGIIVFTCYFVFSKYYLKNNNV